MKNFLRSFVYATRGIIVAFASERNLKIQVAIAALVVAAAFYFNVTTIEWCILLMSSGIVISLELINSSIENLVDLVTREQLPLAAKIKDISAGAVLVFSIVALVAGILIFGPYIVKA
jgi:diacylglycerol kinase